VGRRHFGNLTPERFKLSLSQLLGVGGVPIYKLEPIEGTERHADWWASTLAPTLVWVRAANPDHARHRMHLATTTFPPDQKNVCAPWTNVALIKCIEDQSREVPANVALFANGKITIKLQPYLS